MVNGKNKYQQDTSFILSLSKEGLSPPLIGYKSSWYVLSDTSNKVGRMK